ncbi:MAG: FHA domain-containing protein [Polyangiaceae bacterium]|nr:FHA domain-containing protein [Polyangiaceae bacterium]
MSMFTVVVDDAQGQPTRMSFSTSTQTVVIGRGKTCQVLVASNGASRQHALLTFAGGQFTIADRGTTNGTYVNTTRIQDVLALAPGDTIEIGGIFLHIEADASVWTNPRPFAWGKPSVRERKSSNKKPQPPSNKAVNLSDLDTDTFLAVRSVSADVRIDGPLATTNLVITFHNDLGRTIEGDLVFPLPPMAALRSLVVKIGGRSMTGKVRRRERAQAEYQRALEAGASAALGESEGEDLARLRIAPIEHGEDVEVSLTVDQMLLPISDGHRLIVPLTYMPRYVEAGSELNETEKAALNRPRPLTLAARATAAVHIAHPDGKTPSIRCVSHKVSTKPGERETVIELRDAALDRDLQIEIADRPRGDKPAIWICHDAANGPDDNGPTTTVAIVPPAFADEGVTIARNVVFLVDRSGSMQGAPMASAIRAVRGALRSLGPDDRFNVIAFDNQLEALAFATVPFDDATLSAADAFISRITARGGTEAQMALQAALKPELSPGVPVAIEKLPPRDQTYRLRVVVFMTDGDVAYACGVLRHATDKLFDTRVHVLGIGDAVNHSMLAELAELGGGTYTPVATNEDLEKALVRLKNAITAPLWTGIRVLVERDGERKAPKMLEPPGPIDLFAAEPVLFSFRGPLSPGDKLVLVGQKAEGEDQRVAVELSVPANARAEGAATAWALLRNRRLTYRFDPADDDTLEGLGTAFGVVNRKVALVAVDSEQRQAPIEGHVPVVLPQPHNMRSAPVASAARAGGYGPPPPIGAAPVRFGGPPPPPPMMALGAPPPAPGGFGPPPPGFGPPPPGFGPPPPGFGPPPAPPGFGPTPPGFGPPPMPSAPQIGPPPPPAPAYGAPPPMAGFGPPPPPAMGAPPPAPPAPMRMAAPSPPSAAKPASSSAGSLSFTNDDAGLRALLLHQKADGLFGGDIASTLAAVAALVGHGHTAREGLFRAELRRTTMTLRSKLPSLSGNEQLLARLALALLVMPHGDPAPEGLPAEMAAKLEGLSLSDLPEARAKVRSVLAIAPSGWDGSPLAMSIKQAFL